MKWMPWILGLLPWHDRSDRPPFWRQKRRLDHKDCAPSVQNEWNKACRTPCGVDLRCSKSRIQSPPPGGVPTCDGMSWRCNWQSQGSLVGKCRCLPTIRQRPDCAVRANEIHPVPKPPTALLLGPLGRPELERNGTWQGYLLAQQET
jgi:hypothetical protein